MATRIATKDNIRVLSSGEMQDALKVMEILGDYVVNEHGVLSLSDQAIEVVLTNCNGEQIVILWDSQRDEWIVKLCHYEDRDS